MILIKWTGIIIAGGQSSRMGQNKALLPLAGIPVIDRLVKELSGVAERVVISGGGQPEVYRYLGLEIVEDTYPGAGPLAGLHAGLSVADTSWCLVTACDMPFANGDIFKYLAARAIQAERGGLAGGVEAVIPVTDGRMQPLLAAYRRSVLPRLEQVLQQGDLKMTRWAEGLQAEYVDGMEMAGAIGIPSHQLPFNMNTPDDYRQAQKWLNSFPKK